MRQMAPVGGAARFTSEWLLSPDPPCLIALVRPLPHRSPTIGPSQKSAPKSHRSDHPGPKETNDKISPRIHTWNSFINNLPGSSPRLRGRSSRSAMNGSRSGGWFQRPCALVQGHNPLILRSLASTLSSHHSSSASRNSARSRHLVSSPFSFSLTYHSCLPRPPHLA